MTRRAGLSLIVTFATDLRQGNPAFVLTDTGDASDEALAGMCDLLGTGVIAVIRDVVDGEPALDFFTPEGPHPGAGHATLAAAHVALRGREGVDDLAAPAVTFRLRNGDRRLARASGERIAVGFPVMAAVRVDRVAEMEAALGARPTETFVAPFGYVGVFEDTATVAGMRPDMVRVGAFDRTAVIATAPGAGQSDIVVRVFAPNAGLPEDPVCGTAHRIIIPYWAGRMGKTRLHSRHLSPRGGDLWCEVSEGEVMIAGESRLAVSGTLDLPDV